MSNLAPLLSLLVFMSIFSSMAYADSPKIERHFKRPDPLHQFKNYNGEYNVTNKHYWASAAFTGVHCYAIGAVWLLCGLGFGIFVVCYNMHQTDHSSPFKQHPNYYYIMFFIIFVFTILAIMATSFVLALNENSFHRTKKLEGTIMKAGVNTSKTIYKVVKVLTQMQSLLRPYDPGTSMRLYTISHLLARDASMIRDFITKSSHAINLAIQTSHAVHIVIVAVNLAFLIASLVLLLLHWHPRFITLIFVCWILTTICWAMAGLDFFLHTFADDTCRGFYDFEQNPQNSSLGAIIPCVDEAFSTQLLAELGNTVHNFISLLNGKLSELRSMVVLDGKNMEFLRFGQVCDPFSGRPNYTYMPESCPPNAIPIGDLPDMLSYLTCYNGNSTETCQSNGKIIPQTFYDMARAYSRSVQDLLDVYPDLERLTKCIIVKMTFSDLVKNQCKPFKKSIWFLWASVLSLSISMVVLVLAWVAKAYQEKGRQFSKWCILPLPRNEINLEAENN